MRTIKIIMSICVVVILLAAVAGTASAFQPVWQECTTATKGSFENSSCTKEKTEGGHAWLEVYETRSVKSSEKALSISDTKAKGGALKVECTATAEGWIARESEGAITAVTLSSCVRVSGTECEGTPTVKAIDLPWSTTLEEGIKDKLKAGSKGPGFKIECATKRIDECFGTIATTMKNNAEKGAAEAEFPSEALDECSSGGAKSGEIKGTFALKATESTVGAIRVVTPANVPKFKIKQSAKEGEILATGEMVEFEIENISGAATTPLVILMREDPLNRFTVAVAERIACERQYAANGALAMCKIKARFTGNAFSTLTLLVFDDTGRYAAHTLIGS
jgi:hypothetical protein